MGGNLGLAKEIIKAFQNDKTVDYLGEEEKKNFEELKNNVDKLREYFQRVKNLGVLIERQEKYSRAYLSPLFDPNTQIFRGTEIENKETERRFGEYIFQCYFLTEKILTQLHLIDKVEYEIVYNTKGGGRFFSVGNEDLLIYGNTVQLQLNKDGYSLRLQEKQFRKTIQDKRRTLSQNEKEAQQHYKNFTNVLRKKSFKPSRGYLAEAFIRHQEEISHSNQKGEYVIPNGEFNDRRQRAKVWLQYFQSTGKVPYYYGPDTKRKQVKTVNASLISNVDTVLLTVQAILNLLNKDHFKSINSFNKQVSEIFKTPKGEANIEKAVEQGLDQMDEYVEEYFKKKFNIVDNP